MGRYSKQRIFYDCNVNRHCLDIELLNPLYIDGERVRHVYVTKILEPELIHEMLKELPAVSNDYEGKIRVRAFLKSPDDMSSMEIDLNNIDRISKIG